MKKCSVCGREHKKITKGMCQKHYMQMLRYGHCLDANPRTVFDPNEIIIYEDYAEIVTYDKSGEEKARVLIDLDDIEKIKEYKWSINKRGYASSSNHIRLHRLIMNPPEDIMVDHINGNPLDNRKTNLRLATPQQNASNAKKRTDNTSGYKGVYWKKELKKWNAYINTGKRRIYLGYFDNLEEAIEARKQAEIKHYGEYRRDEDVS